ncbi:hypothetical protein LPJ78_000150 [Coemansia sp. RSA 989]|nr:hypothetical protein LPJ78_000150 [Coemansia sp. RSA 989]
MSKSPEAYAAGLSRSRAFDALPRATEEKDKTRIPKITVRRAIYLFIWFMIQLTIMAIKLAQGSKSGDTYAGYNKGVESLMMTTLSFNFLLMSPTLMRMLRATPLRKVVCFDKVVHAHKIVAYTLVFWILHHVISHYYKFHQLEIQTKGKLKMVDLLYGKQTGRVGHAMLAIIIVILLTALPVVRKKFFEIFYLLHHLNFLIVILIFVHIQKHTFQYYISGPMAIYALDRIYRMVRARVNSPQILSIIQHPSNVIELRFERRGMKYKVGQYVYLCVPSISWHQWHPFTLTSAPEENELSVHIRVAGGWTNQLVYKFQQCANRQPPQMSALHVRSQQRSAHRQNVQSVDSECTLVQSFNQNMHGGSIRGRGRGRGRPGHRGGGRVQRHPSSRSARNAPMGPRYPPEIDSRSGSQPYPGPHIRGNRMLPSFGSMPLPKIMVDGPYCAPTQDVFDYSHILLICGNIGVTPMSSVLKSLYYQLTESKGLTSIKKVYFIWTCRDVQALEWFRDLLAALDMEDIGDILEMRTYLTGELPVELIRNISLNQSSGGPDAVTGLYRSPTYYGRPNFDSIFGEIGQRNPATNIGVFFCGSQSLGRSLLKMSSKWNGELKHRNTKFDFHEERSTE